MKKMYGDQTNMPNLVSVKVLLDVYSSLGNEYVPYKEFISKILPKVDIKQTDIKNIYPNYVLYNTDKCDIEHTSTPTKHATNIDEYDFKHTTTPIKHGLLDPILSQSDIIQVHQQKVKILAEMEREVCREQNQKTLTNIHDIYNRD